MLAGIILLLITELWLINIWVYNSVCCCWSCRKCRYNEAIRSSWWTQTSSFQVQPPPPFRLPPRPLPTRSISVTNIDLLLPTNHLFPFYYDISLSLNIPCLLATYSLGTEDLMLIISPVFLWVTPLQYSSSADADWGPTDPDTLVDHHHQHRRHLSSNETTTLSKASNPSSKT